VKLCKSSKIGSGSLTISGKRGGAALKDDWFQQGGEETRVAEVNTKNRINRIGRPRTEVDIDKILTLYIDRKMSVREVAKVIGVSHVTVARRIAEKKGQLRSWRMPGER